MSITAKEISEILKKKIENYDAKLELDEVGEVVSDGDGIAVCCGLNQAFYGEKVIFESGVEGMVLNLEEDKVGVVLFDGIDQVHAGMSVKRTHEVMDICVGDELLGRVINPLGQPLDGKGEINTGKRNPVEKIAPGVMTRKSVDRTLETGILAIDSVVPIGKGQRELIIGDRKTGKTQIAIDTILNQKGKNVNCIYVAIGQKQSTIANIVRILQEQGAMEYTTIVLASASDLAPLQYLAPYAGVSIGEEWMAQGKDVLIVYDDLSKHAAAYRTLSLLLKRPPGREAYPGDVFYLHSRLLERAAQLNDDLGNGSITALPIIETQAGDISAYIPTNVISITDGQLFLTTELFNSGQRPAIDPGLSVSRVGGAAQKQIIKKLSGGIKLSLAQYRELEAFTKFGSELDENTAKVIAHGKRLMECLRQNANSPYSGAEEASLLFAVTKNYLKDVNVEKIDKFKSDLFNQLNNFEADLANKINTEAKLTDDVQDGLKRLVETVLEQNDYE